MSRIVEDYIIHPGEYDREKNSHINNYVHPKITPGKNLQIHDYEIRLGEEVRDELESLVVQSVANWPTVDHSKLISDRLNVSPKDVDKTMEDLLDGGVIRQISEIEFHYQEPLAHLKINKIKEEGITQLSRIKGLTNTGIELVKNISNLIKGDYRG